MFKITAHRIKYNHRTGIADMDQIIYGGAADIHFNLTGGNRHKVFFSLCQGVVNFHLDWFSFFLFSNNFIVTVQDAQFSVCFSPHDTGQPSCPF